MPPIAVAAVLTLSYAGAMLWLSRFRTRHGVFMLNVDLIDPRNYEPKGRWLIPVAIVLAIGALAAWVRVLAS